uniref:cytochrome c oxidase subunit II n=1 Tax=Elthusa poutassouiensis TaxID=3104314 RepID=UPI002E78E44E|nr:cytochrome c oxidase subunit II [Elthusa poutassouiensis]WPS93550.1 cytochrome c oxidase subunit II [Elthusa poutassouiensis]
MMWWNDMNIQNNMSPLMEQLSLFHDHTMIIISSIIILTIYIMLSSMLNKFINRPMLENQPLEFIWTIVPAFILIFIALPSLRLLYLLDETHNPSMTIKSIGHQWYWSYEYSDLSSKEFDSYMIPEGDLNLSMFRLLETDNHVVIPMLTQIRMLTSSSDVIHSWTIPSLGVKADAIPGRLNQLNIMTLQPGLFYGQCSEICGANHSFMPITIESVSMKTFLKWLNSDS